MNRFGRAARVLLQQRTHHLSTVPIVVVNLNDICNSRCLSCAIWQNNERIREPGLREMSDGRLEEVYAKIDEWRPMEVLLTGGEPTMHPRFLDVVSRLGEMGPSVLVATNALTLSRFTPGEVRGVESFFVSFDAPDAGSYRKIRGVDGYDRMAEGIQFLRRLDPCPRIVARCTLQRENVSRLPELVDAARESGCDQISFLAVDRTSAAFGRGHDDHAVDNDGISPMADGIERMREGIAILEERPENGFIESGIDRLRSLHRTFLARIGCGEAPPVRCNAPWVSVVVETSGEIRPCFFHPVVGSLDGLNGDRAVRFRASLDVSKHPTCQECVCSKRVGSRDLLAHSLRTTIV